MANAKSEHDTLPKLGKVNEVCKEWTIREDGALAYHLQNQEINQHYESNRFRNAVVREDFPRALDEQVREQQLAEQAAAVYHQMLAEQEEIDGIYAKQLATKLELEEKSKIKVLDVSKEKPDMHLLVEKLQGASIRPQPFHMSVQDRNGSHSSTKLNNINHGDPDLYVEPCRSTSNSRINKLDDLSMVDIGIPLDDASVREIQEHRDAQLARHLQEQENSGEQSQLIKDRMLAMEVQDKELAKLLQERERQKVKRARERAKQKSLAKKQQDINQIMPDDSYSNPIDLLPTSQTVAVTNEDINYAFPINTTPPKLPPPARPTQLDLKTSNKPLQSTSSPSQHVNIAMAIDPTYNRRSQHSIPFYDTSSSSTVTTSTSSSSPSMLLPSPELVQPEQDNNVPPYMPIQGQRRMASLEKKPKKKSKDNCKQQ